MTETPFEKAVSCVIGRSSSRKSWPPGNLGPSALAVLVTLVATVLVARCGSPDGAAEPGVEQAGETGTADPRTPGEAKEPSAARTVGTVAAPDGVEIHYETAGRGEPALVFVHGWSCDRSYWEAQVEYFAASHRVVAIDLGGHGQSGLGRKEWTMAAFGEDVLAVVEELGLQNVVLVGHSMGGHVIVEAARLLPDHVVALVPVEMFWEVDRPMSAEERKGFLAPMRADFSNRTEAFVRNMFTEDSDPLLVDRIARDMAAGPPAVGISAMEHIFSFDEGAALVSVKVPMRVINADLWPTDLDALRRHKPDVELAVMPGVGHFVMQEDPDEFNRLLARAVRELVPGT